MDHLFNSRVAVYRLDGTATDGILSTSWLPVTGLEYVKCRLDIGLLRPGKDQPMPVEAGKAPDRIGVLYCLPAIGIKAGDRIIAVPNDYGLLPVEGTFEIKIIPEPTQAFAFIHHIEVQVVEVGNIHTFDNFPGAK